MPDQVMGVVPLLVAGAVLGWIALRTAAWVIVQGHAGHKRIKRAGRKTWNWLATAGLVVAVVMLMRGR